MKEECRHTLERAYLFLDGEILNDGERLEIKVHFEQCRPCLERYGLEGEVVAVLARLQGCNPCPDTLRSRIRNLLENS